MQERLASSDRGVALLREVMLREIRQLRAGHDPKGVICEASRHAALIDTHLTETIRQFAQVGADAVVNTGT